MAAPLLLLGGGYSLKKLAQLLPNGSFLITTRSEQTANEWIQKGYEAIILDLLKPETLVQIRTHLSSVTTVIDSVPPNREGDPDRGIRNLLSIPEFKPKRIFYLSTTGVYGKSEGEIVTEETPADPLYPSSEARVACEETYAGSPFPTTRFRLSGIYGPGRGIGQRLLEGRYALFEDGSRWTNRIHRDDIAGVLKAAIDSSHKLPPILNINDNEPAPQLEVVQYYCKTFEFPFPKQISESEAKAAGRDRLFLNQRVSNELLHRTLSYEFQYPTYREGAATEFEEE